MNHLGDWDMQFGLIAIGFEKDAESDPGVKAAAAA